MHALVRRLTLVLVFAIPWEQTVGIPGVGTLTRLIGLAVVVPWALIVLDSGARRLDAAHGALFALVVWAGFSVFWSVDPTTSLAGFFTVMQLFAFTLVAWEVFDTHERIDSALQAYVLGAVVAAVGALVNFSEGHANGITQTRYAWSGVGVGTAALILAIGLPMAIHLGLGAGGRGRPLVLRAVNLAYVPLAVFAMVITGTRSAALALVPVVAYLFMTLVRVGPAAVLAGVATVVVCVTVVVAYAPPTSLTRIGSAGTELEAASGERTGGDGFNGRTEIWREGLAALEQRPLTGVGQSAYAAATPTGKVAHNTPLSVLVELGVVGFVLFLFVVVRMIGIVRRLSGERLAFWAVELIVLSIPALSKSLGEKKVLWLVIALALAAGAVPRRSQVRDTVRSPSHRPSHARRPLPRGQPLAPEL